MRHVVCDTCSRLLPVDDPDTRMLDRLSSLARFGLIAGAAPILKS